MASRPPMSSMQTKSTRAFEKSTLMVYAIGFLSLSAASQLTFSTIRGVSFGDVLRSDGAPSKSASTNGTTSVDVVDRRHPKEMRALDDFRKIRQSRFRSYWHNNGNSSWRTVEGAVGGPVLDFLIAGFPKCGTTGMMRTLSAVAFMPNSTDVCTPIKQTAYYSYVNWPQQYDGVGPWEYSAEKPLTGSKCPYHLEKNMRSIKKYMPQTKLIVGIRHPVLWFQSFVNQVRQIE